MCDYAFKHAVISNTTTEMGPCKDCYNKKTHLTHLVIFGLLVFVRKFPHRGKLQDTVILAQYLTMISLKKSLVQTIDDRVVIDLLADFNSSSAKIYPGHTTKETVATFRDRLVLIKIKILPGPVAPVHITQDVRNPDGPEWTKAHDGEIQKLQA